MNKNTIIHIGLHKTASTFMQQYFFPLYQDEIGYIELRDYAQGFLTYVLHSNELEFDSNIAYEIFNRETYNIRKYRKRLLISDEQFCGSPWDNAQNRKIYFDRLNQIFPDAYYIIVLRNQHDMLQSLYLQYIKTGGSANWREFLNHKRHPLNFSLKSYLNYGNYIKYISSRIGKERIGCFFYEDMKSDPKMFLKQISEFSGFEVGNNLSNIIVSKANKSISPRWVNILIYVNKFVKSERQPFLLLPKILHFIIIRMCIKLSFSNNKEFIPVGQVAHFCKNEKNNNYSIIEIIGREIKHLGY